MIHYLLFDAKPINLMGCNVATILINWTSCLLLNGVLNSWSWKFNITNWTQSNLTLDFNRKNSVTIKTRKTSRKCLRVLQRDYQWKTTTANTSITTYRCTITKLRILSSNQKLSYCLFPVVVFHVIKEKKKII